MHPYRPVPVDSPKVPASRWQWLRCRLGGHTQVLVAAARVPLGSDYPPARNTTRSYSVRVDDFIQLTYACIHCPYQETRWAQDCHEAAVEEAKVRFALPDLPNRAIYTMQPG